MKQYSNDVNFSIGKVDHAVSEFKKKVKLKKKLKDVNESIDILVKTMSDKEYNEYIRKTISPDSD